jgi:MinD-like ATPase involved in chromosome partitioning or flagellar assembly
MRGVRIPQGLSGEDQFVLGLSVPRLAALLLGLLAAYTILHLTLPAPIQLPAAALAALLGAAIAWVRPEGRSLIHWALAAIEFKLTERYGAKPSAERTFADRQEPAHGQARSATVIRQPQLQVLTPPAKAAVLLPEAPASAGDDGIDEVIELPDDRAAGVLGATPKPRFEDAPPAPVYLGGPQVITFFSTKGGTGRTSLATEVACLLAIKGHYRESPIGAAQRLRVALIDFDLASANVSARLGLAQPTMLDYLCDSGVQSPDPRDFLIHHPSSGVDVMLGPSKCLAGDRAELMGVGQAAHILSSFKAAGYQFLIVDMAASLGDLETYLLEAATRIYCVVTPTAGSVQSLYRGVEALRRLGLAPKLHYVANKMRDGVSLDEAMGDLDGSLAASIPYDSAFDTAENQHQPLAVQQRATSIPALTQLAASVYPSLQMPTTNRTSLSPFAWLGRRRRAG